MMMPGKFDLLTALDKVHVFSAPVASSVNVKLKPGMFVAIVNKQVVLPPTDGYAPVYCVLSDMDEPVTKASKTVGLMYGNARIKTSVVQQGTYAPGDPITAGSNGLLKKATGSSEHVIGFVEDVVVEDGVTYYIIRLNE